MAIADLFRSKKKTKKDEQRQLQTAAATLMYKMAWSDGYADKSELVYIRGILASEFNLDSKELSELMSFAGSEQNQQATAAELATELRKSCGNAKRVKMLEYLWVLAFADDRIDIKESDLLETVSQLLYLNDAEKTRAQEAAEEVVGLGF